MKNHIENILFLFVLLICPYLSHGQNIFSEKELEYKKGFLPYDVPYTFALENKQFIQLLEVKKNTMKLGRYDQYFFEQWEINIEFDLEESAPQAFIKGDTIFVYSFTTNKDEKQTRLTFRFFDIESGNEFDATNYVFGINVKEGFDPKITFSEDKAKFAIYHYLINDEDNDKVEFRIFSIGDESPERQYHLESEVLSATKTSKIHLSNSGDLFLVAIEASEFKAKTYFWGSKSNEVIQVNNNFFFERPVDKIEEINIVRQSSSSYFVSFSANIENELIGFNITGYNVVLKTVMFSNNQNLRKDDIGALYENYYETGADQKKKYMETPEVLENFSLVQSYVNTQNDIILLFENLEIPIEYHKVESGNNMPWKHKSKEDKFYLGGDILMYCYSESGVEKWKKTIQKTQFSQGSGLGLSFISQLDQNQLHLLLYESSKGGNFYVLDLNTQDGSLTGKVNLLPGRKFEFTKKYSCWLTEKAIILCGISPVNINKRTLMLVEF